MIFYNTLYNINVIYYIVLFLAIFIEILVFIVKTSKKKDGPSVHKKIATEKHPHHVQSFKAEINHTVILLLCYLLIILHRIHWYIYITTLSTYELLNFKIYQMVFPTVTAERQPVCWVV